MGDEHVGTDRRRCDGREILDGVIGDVRQQKVIDDVRTADDDQRVTVGRGPHQRFVAYDRVPAGPVVDDDLLSQRSVSFGPMMRATPSTPPPGGKGTIMRTGLLG